MSEKSSFGRPEAVTKEQVLETIRILKDTSASRIAKRLKADRATIYRKMQKISPEEISEALGVSTEKNLPLNMMDSKKGFVLFKELPIMKDYKNKLLYSGKGMSKRKSMYRMRMVWRLCIWFRVKPSALTSEQVADLVQTLKKDTEEGKKARAEFKGGYEIRVTARSFFQLMKNEAGKKLTGMGLGAELYPKNITRSQARLSKEQRAAFMKELVEATKENFSTSDGIIRFAENPAQREAVRILPKLMYYIGIRATSAFEKCFWETAETRDERQHRVKFSGVIGLDTFKKGDELKFRHLDKGKMGGIAWTKHLFGEFAEAFHAFWLRIGKPLQGLVMMGLKVNAVRELFKFCYEKAGIPKEIWEGNAENEPMPFHIWRHTAAQDLLDASDWNYELVAEILGWESIDVLKAHYGSMPPDTQKRLVLKAQGVKVDEAPRLFIF